MSSGTLEAPAGQNQAQQVLPAESEEFGKAGDTKLAYAALDQIFVDDALNSRKQYPQEAMEEMVDSIFANNGIYNALLVTHGKPGSTKTDRPFTLVAGFRRAKALMLIRDRMRAKGENPGPFIDQIPITILENVDVENFHVVQLVENLLRQDLNPIEVGDAIERAIEESKDPVTGKQITASRLAKQLGISEAKVSQYRAICQLPDFIKEGVSKGEIPFVNARTIVAVPVPTKHLRQAARMAAIMSGPEFEAKCRKQWGTRTETGAAAGSESGSQKTRATRSAKEVKEEYLPELKKRLDAAKGDDKKRLEYQLDGIKWMLMEEGTELGKKLVPFEEARAAEELKQREVKAQETAKTRLLAQLTSLMRKHINRPLEEGQTKPTRAEALKVAMATVAKDYDKSKKTYPVKSGKEEQGKAVTTTAFLIPDLAAFETQLLEHWNSVEQKKSEARVKKENEKKAAEEAAKREQAGAAEGATTGVQTNVVDNAQGEKAAGGMNQQNAAETNMVATPTAVKEKATEANAKEAAKQGQAAAKGDGGQGDKAAATGTK